MKKIVLIIGINLWTFTFSAQGIKNTVEELMQKSGSTTMFLQLDDVVTAKIEEKSKSFQNIEDFEKFKLAMRSGLNSKEAIIYFKEYFELSTDQDSLNKVLELYKSSLVQKMTKLELAANDASKQKEMGDFISKLSENTPSENRMLQLNTLNDVIGASDMTNKLLKNMIISMAKGINEMEKGDKKLSQLELENKLINSLPPEFFEQMKHQIISMYVYIYKDVSDKDLQEYINIWKTPTGKYYSKHSLKALDYTFSIMGRKVGNNLNVFSKDK